MNNLTIVVNGEYVDVEFSFDAGYPATFDDPGCDDDCEIHKVFYPANSKDQVDILPVMHEDDIESLYDYIYAYKGHEND
jgi:hypothetical protein